MSFKITITNNENGEVLFDDDNAVAIIGSVVNGEHRSVLGYTDCKVNDLMNAIMGVDEARDAVFDKNPMAKLLYGLKELMSDEH